MPLQMTTCFIFSVKINLSLFAVSTVGGNYEFLNCHAYTCTSVKKAKLPNKQI
ncbi:hypothetical protein GQ55_7G169900 [Panicum hallii var. hallii]|uniref:Uncharacterized protein n=2 Tax=Panicum hallii TaxID=206008 RepID=A0A2T7CVX7_9POAL|nr:hypothetical protein GQ55_7G169900 [Panicum hallii var. hallii]PVH35421.1 hypothetical protein PAHAL_7G178900 [Panicum hallii]